MTEVQKNEAFWNWFSSKQEELFRFEENQDQLFEELESQLTQINPDLTFEFGPVQEGRREFVISASGIVAAFPSVEELFQSKPELSRFEVIAFRPARAVIGDIETDTLAMRSDDVFYQLAQDEEVGKLGILLFLPGYDSERHDEFGQIGFLFLDEALGEYLMETEVGFIDILGHDSEYFEDAEPIGNLFEQFIGLMPS